MKTHVSIHVTGVVDIEVISPLDIKARLEAFEDHASVYIDDGAGGRGPPLSPSVAGVIIMTSGELVCDALKSKIVDALKKSTQDITLQMSNPGADA